MTRTLIDVRYAARCLLRTRGFSLTVLLVLALGIGSNAAIFSLVNGVLLSPLPYVDSDRLMWIGESAPGWDLPDLPMSFGAYVYYKQHSRLIEDAGLYLESSATLASDAEPERVRMVAMTPSLLSTLGVRPSLGRPFAQEDDLGSPPRVVLLGHDFWRRRFGADAAVVGQTIRVNGNDREIIGVMPPGFGIPDPGVPIYTTMNTPPSEVRFGGFFRPAVVRVSPDVTPDQLKAEMDSLLLSMPEVYDVTVELIEDAGMEAIVTPLKERVLGDTGRSLWMLFAGLGLMLAIACATVSSLMVVRAESRSREAAVRQALGASRARVRLHFVSEAVLLGVGGGIIGLGLAQAGIGFVRESGVTLPRLYAVSVGAEEAAFALLLSVVASLLLGAFPAWWYTRLGIANALQGGVLAMATSRRRYRGRRAVVAAQTALTLPLLFGSALMVQSFWRLAQVDPGFDTGGVLTAQLVLTGSAYPMTADVAQFYASLAERLESVAGIDSAAFTTALPLTPGIRSDPLWVDGVTPADDELPPFVTFKYVSSGYFEAMSIPLLEGNLVTRSRYDAEGRSVTVNRKLADQLLTPGPALGRRVGMEMRNLVRYHTVAAVVGDVLDDDIRSESTPILYFPLVEENLVAMSVTPRAVSVVVRTSGDPLAFAGALRAAVWELDPELPVAGVQPLAAVVRSSVAHTRFMMTMLVLAASAALLMGTVGLYALVSFTVGQRTREIGVRIALGARASDIRRMVLAEGAALAVIGVAIGAVAALSVGRLFASLVHEISPSDPATLVVMSAVLLAVALGAAYIPARRAAALEPTATIRGDAG